MLFEDPTVVDDFAAAAQVVLGAPLAIREPGRPLFQLDEDARRAELHGTGFVEVRCEFIDSVQTFDTAAIRALYATMATVLRRPKHEQARTLDALEALIRDDFDGQVARPFRTALYTAQAPISPTS
jgi:hypothetical protein